MLSSRNLVPSSLSGLSKFRSIFKNLDISFASDSDKVTVFFMIPVSKGRITGNSKGIDIICLLLLSIILTFPLKLENTTESFSFLCLL